MNKRGYYFTLDAMIGLVIILGVLMTVNTVKQEEQTSSPDIQRDLIETLTSLKMSEINNSYAETLRQENKTSENFTVLEQIVEYHARDMSEGKELTESIFQNLETSRNFGMWFDGELIASNNESPLRNSTKVWSSRQFIRGIEKSEGEGIRGYSAKAQLIKSKDKEYHYFGGYFGEGNISLKIDCKGSVENVALEIATNKNFDIYINGEFSGHYENSSTERNPSKYDISSYSERFVEGENIVKLAGEDLYVAGGHLKITYNSSQPYNRTNRYHFPGIEGLINVYDGFYVPGNLTNMNISLHMDNNYSSFLKIGNTTVFNGSTTGEETIKINNTELSSELDYSKISKKTIPLRLGLENASYLFERVKGIGDVFSVTDISGSMCGTCSGGDSDCCTNWFWDVCNNDQPQCESCGGVCEDSVYNVKDANKVFIDSILNITGNQVGLVGYEADVSNDDVHHLSTNKSSLDNQVDEWDAVGGTCICCGINEAANRLSNVSDNRVKSILVMSDGEANYECSQQGTGDPKQDAIQSACDAYNNHDITVHAVGFGSNADEATLQDIADCGRGGYYYGTVENIISLYENISEEIINASYEKQTITSTGEAITKLYPDSYIEFDYEKEELPFGLYITSESKNFNSSSMTNFYVPKNSTVAEARAISYSGPKWTKSLGVYDNGSWDSVYNLSKYNEKYIKLGDPYTVNIPSEKIVQGNNVIGLKTGLSPYNSSSSSPADKIIYTVIKKALGYSPVSSTSEGCDWIIEFDDLTNTTLEVPENNNNTQTCYFTNEKISYDENDAIAKATYDLLKELDFDSDNRVNSKFSENDMNIETSGIKGIPYTTSAEVEIRIWR